MARRERSQIKGIEEINMTPLIDLVFLLLIVFMLTAPTLECGIDVSPPEMNAEPIPDENSKFITLNKYGKIVFDNKEIPSEQLVARLKDLKARNPKLSIFIRGDGGRQYREVMDLMRTVKKAGIKEVNLVTLAEQ